MTLPLRNSLDEFPLHWLRRLAATCRKCWKLVPSDPARVLGAMQWYWCGRRMAAYGSVLTFAALMLTQKRTPTLYLEHRRHWRVW